MRAARARYVLLAVLSAALVGSGAERSRAQSAALMAQAHTPTEQEAIELLDNGLLVSARTRAEEVLRANPDSIVGHYVLGRAFFDAEGSLARAMYHLGRARELYERAMPGVGNELHQEMLFQVARLAGQMELYEYQLELLGYHDHLYDPDMIAERCWPLMKLGRMEEARQFAQTAVGSPNRWQRSAGLNALCAVEGEARTRQPYHEACMDALRAARQEVAGRQPGSEDEGGGIAVDAYNAALGAAAALRFEEAERVAREGVRRFEPTPANPWRVLVEIYLSEGRMDQALDAFGQMIRWNDRTPASLRDQSRADIEATVAMVMLMAGESEQALARIDRALDRPDRRGLTTDGAEQARGRHALLRRMIRRTLLEERAERASWTGRGAQALNLLASAGGSLGSWPDGERVIAVLTDERRLTDTLRPYVPGGIDNLSPWMTGELVEVLGPAVVSVALDEARARDGEEPGAEAAYLALEAEVAAARGDGSEAIRLADQAIAGLSAPGWALVRARVAAVAAAAAEEAGNARRANELYATAMQADPTIIRRLGLSLPTRVRSVTAGAEASEAAALLARSPRFSDRSGGFELVVSETASGPLGGLRACLRTATGNEIRCADVRREPPAPEEPQAPAAPDRPEPEAGGQGDEPAEDPEPEEEEEEELTLPQRLAQEVHRQLFSARIELSTVDLSSLDGRTTGGSAVANERLRDLLNEGTE